MRGRGGYQITRRNVLQASAAILTGCGRPAVSAVRPTMKWGVQSGDITTSSAVIWSRSDRHAALEVECNGRTFMGSHTLETTDFTAKVRLDGLPADTRLTYRARFRDSEWEVGSLRTAPMAATRPVRLAWSGDTNGQGYGIDPARGGMPAYTALLHEAPDLFIHLGDTIYADNPIPPSLVATDGTTWTNLVDPGKAHVAETLDDYWANHRYPRLSAEVRACSANIPIVAIWDDHEVRDNWFPGEMLDDERYREKSVDVLAGNANHAFYDYQPTLLNLTGPMYRVVHQGPLADIFMLDGRSYRSPNEPPPAEGGLLGPVQTQWLINSLKSSRAKWKIVACDMPIALQIGEPGKQIKWAADGWGNEDSGAPREREVELARILTAIRGVKNVVWLGADVHYAAAHRFDPTRAAYTDFDPFWELIAGPMHATAFGRKSFDPTFGPSLEWCSVDWETRGSPADGKQYFGILEIDPALPDLQVRWVDARGSVLHRLVIPAS